MGELIHTQGEPRTFAIGGVFTLVLIEGENGYIGEYTNLKTKQNFVYDGTGLTQKQILTKFWDMAKKVNPAAKKRRGFIR